MESGRRNTRSNGASPSKKGLRSGKAYKSSESGSGDEESGTDSETSDDSTYADKEVSKLQVSRAGQSLCCYFLGTLKSNPCGNTGCDTGGFQPHPPIPM